MKEVTLDGIKITDKDTFYDQVEAELTKDLDFSMGRNLNAFNDVLRGGFGVHEYEERVRLTWRNWNTSRRHLDREFMDSIIEIAESHVHVDFKIEY